MGLTRQELRSFLEECEALSPREIPMRLQQIWHWIYHRGVQSFDIMHNIGKPLRRYLEESACLTGPEIITEQISQDGTRKWLLRLVSPEEGKKGAEVECVYIPEPDRGTLCVSSQVGCTLTCSFCHTGTQRWVRNLSAAEIIQQVVLARHQIGDFPALPALRSGTKPAIRAVSNIVFMGMGEPLYNFEAVCQAIHVLSDGEGLSLSKRRITVSTAGVVPQIVPLGEKAGTLLAISLHATQNELRNRLVPLNKKYPIEDLLAACRAYPGLSNSRRITFEYVMLKGVNDSPADARALVRLLKGLPAKINLIPFNPWPGSSYECSSWETIERFSEIIFNAGYASPVRTPRGRDILAACGQLKSETEKLGAWIR